MSVGFVMLCHTALDRAAQVARHWAERDCPVVIHVDKRVQPPEYDGLVKDLSDLSNIRFSKRHACEWGTWGIVAATQEAATIMLRDFAAMRSRGVQFAEEPRQEAYGTVAVFVDLYGNRWDLLELASRD